MGSSEPEIVVVGAGIAGVAASTALRRAGYDVLLLDRALTPSTRFNGETIQPYGVTLLRHLGIDCLTGDARRITRFRFLDCDDAGTLRDELTVTYPAGTYAIAHRGDRLTARLWAYAHAVLGERFVTGATATATKGELIDAKAPDLMIRSPERPLQRIRPRLLIACDGRISAVRRLLGGDAPVPRRSVAGSSLDLIAGGEIDMSDSGTQMCHVMRAGTAGTFSVFGLDDTTQRVYWNTPARGSEPSTLPERFLRAFATLPMPWRAAPLSRTVRAMPAETRWGGPPADGACFFAGDAAAVTTAFGGQGMTCALEHVTALLASGAASTTSLRTARAYYAAAVRRSYRRANALNFVLYHLFFSRRPAIHRISREVVRRWTADASLADLAGRLFSGAGGRGPTLSEFVRALGVLDTPRLLKSIFRNSPAESA